MNWSNITTIPRSQKIMLKTGSGMQVVGSVWILKKYAEPTNAYEQS